MSTRGHKRALKEIMDVDNHHDNHNRKRRKVEADLKNEYKKDVSINGDISDEENLSAAWKSIKVDTCKALIHGIRSRIRKIVRLKDRKITQNDKLEEHEACQCDHCIEYRHRNKDARQYAIICV